MRIFCIAPPVCPPARYVRTRDLGLEQPFYSGSALLAVFFGDRAILGRASHHVHRLRIGGEMTRARSHRLRISEQRAYIACALLKRAGMSWSSDVRIA